MIIAGFANSRIPICSFLSFQELSSRMFAASLRAPQECLCRPLFTMGRHHRACPGPASNRSTRGKTWHRSGLTIRPPTPRFFVSVDSKEFKFSVSRLESILRRDRASADSKGLDCAEMCKNAVDFVLRTKDLGCESRLQKAKNASRDASAMGSRNNIAQNVYYARSN